MTTPSVDREPVSVEPIIDGYRADAPYQPPETCPLINETYNQIRSIAEDVVTEPDWARSRLENLAPKTGSWSIRSGTALEKIRVANAELRAYGDYWERAAEQLADRVEALAARALPTPRRYTGGPLEDGLYLWREDHWPAGKWSSMDPQGLATPNDCSSWVGRYGPFWLIGPIPIPNLPEEEAKS